MGTSLMARTPSPLPPARNRPVPLPPLKIHHPIRFMYENGFIFELNRHFYHPMGLTQTVLPPPAPDEDMILVLYDNTSNPITTFDPATYTSGHNKWRLYWEETGLVVHNLRQRMLGFVVQTKADIREMTNYLFKRGRGA